MMNPTLEEKKNFISWFIQNYQLKRRESLWILNYLLNHEILLKNIHLIEEVHTTNRGMGFAVVGNPKDAFMYYKDGQTFEDPEQAFHDLRLNWKEDFYLELFFDQSYQVLSFFGVLEDNPYIQDSEIFDKDLEEIVEKSLEKLAVKDRIHYLKKQIDIALIQYDETSFRKFTKELKELEEKNMI